MFFGEEEGNGLLNTAKTFATVASYSRYIEDTQSVVSNWGKFAFVFAIGVILIVFSLPFASFLLLNPKPFCMLFSLGSLVLLVSLFQLISPKQVIQKAGSVVSFAVYIGSLLLSLYAGLFSLGYLSTVALIMIQLCSLFYILISQFPGGRSGINVVFQQLKSQLVGCIVNLFTQKKKQSFLPL